MTGNVRRPVCDIRTKPDNQPVVYWLSHPAHSLLQVDNPRVLLIDGNGRRQASMGFRAHLAAIPDHEYEGIPKGGEEVPA
jgi:hypothetical protein